MEVSIDPPDMILSHSRPPQEDGDNTGEASSEGAPASGNCHPDPLGTKRGSEAGGKGGLPTEHAEETPAGGNFLPDPLGTKKGSEAGGKGGLPTEHAEEAPTPTGIDAGHTSGVKKGNDPQLYPSRSI